MVIDHPAQRERRAETYFAAAREMCEAGAEALLAAIRKLREEDPETTIDKALRDHRQSLQTIAEMEKFIDRYCTERAGGGPDAVLNLDAARDEIGRRLACLRAARGD
jgi:hypothetical protein